MKKIFFSLMTVFCGIGLFLQAQIPNNGFENWTAGNPDGWATSNVFPAGIVTVTQTTDKHGGTYALRGEVINFMGMPMAPVVQSGPDATGSAISEKYQSFEVFYKFTSVEGDKFSVNVGFEKEGNPIAQGAAALPMNVGSYTYLSVPMEYFVDDVPDWAIIQISITGPIAGNDYHVGSVMFIDDLSFSMETGIGDQEMPGYHVKCYPNPASDLLYLNVNEAFSGDALVKVFDICGQEVKSITCGQPAVGKDLQISVAGLTSGLYFYTIEGHTGHYSGKFTVSSR
jgi:hypothetical protein